MEDAVFSYIPYSINPTISLSANLKEAIRDLTILRGNFQDVQILIDGSSSMVPFERFDEEKIEELYNFNYPHRKGNTILYNILPKSNATLIYAIDKSAYQLLNETYPKAHYYSVETPVIEYLVEKSKIRDTQKLYVYFHEHTLNIYIFSNGKLYFANNFTYTDLNDALYFILQIWKTQGLNQLTDELHLLGRLPKAKDTQKELHRYIQQVHPINLSKELGINEAESKLQIPEDLLLFIHHGI